MTSHYLNKNDKCPIFSLNVNNLEISILQLPFLKIESEYCFVGGNKQTNDTVFFFEGGIKLSYHRCFKFIRRRHKIVRK